SSRTCNGRYRPRAALRSYFPNGVIIVIRNISFGVVVYGHTFRGVESRSRAYAVDRTGTTQAGDGADNPICAAGRQTPNHLVGRIGDIEISVWVQRDGIWIVE